jgi:mono/diheme cytochrome c family protein
MRRCSENNGRKVNERRKWLSAVIIIGCVASAGAAFALVYRPALDAIARPNSTAFPAPIVERGATRAALGDCAVCHTSETGTPYAGGRPLPTPFGIIYATNITPDEATGIGAWSGAAFRRAMRKGISRDGRHLYPVFPYDHFACTSDDDLDAIYAFLMTRRPVSASPPPNNLIFPLGFRPLLAGWNLLFLHKRCFAPVASQSAEWNRGGYLVEGLGHCGGCHTPRNIAGAEEKERQYSGGVAEGWNAPPLNRSNPAATSWTEEALYNYLHTGIDADHSAAAGPMGPVAHELAMAPEADVKAISVYVASLMGAKVLERPPPSDNAGVAARENPEGATLFVGACGGCHDDGAPMTTADRPSLSRVSVLQEDDPRNTIQVIMRGLPPPVSARGPYMPAFLDSLTDRQVGELVAYLRARYSARPAWPKLENVVAEIREQEAMP